MRVLSFKILALIFVFSIGFSCRFCKSEFTQLKAGELSISNYSLYKSRTLIPFNDKINKTNDTLIIKLDQDFFSVFNYSNNSSDLMACSPSDPEYLDRPDSISITTLSNFDIQTIANSNINHLCNLFDQFNHSIYPISNFEFDRGYNKINICLIKNPTVDSIKLNIKLHFTNGLVRSTDTKWLYFN